MRSILDAADTHLSACSRHTAEFVFRCQHVSNAINKLHPHKNDGNLSISTDYFLHANCDFSVYIALIHGYQ
jgi:hypothetical protein